MQLVRRRAFGRCSLDIHSGTAQLVKSIADLCDALTAQNHSVRVHGRTCKECALFVRTLLARRAAIFPLAATPLVDFNLFTAPRANVCSLVYSPLPDLHGGKSITGVKPGEVREQNELVDRYT